MCIITETHGSTPRKVGSKMLVFPNGKIIGSIGGGREKKVIEDAIDVLESGQARQFDHALVFDHEMCCGGRLSIYIEPMIPKRFTHICMVLKALAELAVELEFNVTVIDERSDLIKALDHPLIQIKHVA